MRMEMGASWERVRRAYSLMRISEYGARQWGGLPIAGGDPARGGRAGMWTRVRRRAGSQDRAASSEGSWGYAAAGRWWETRRVASERTRMWMGRGASWKGAPRGIYAFAQKRICAGAGGLAAHCRSGGRQGALAQGARRGSTGEQGGNFARRLGEGSGATPRLAVGGRRGGSLAGGRGCGRAGARGGSRCAGDIRLCA